MTVIDRVALELAQAGSRGLTGRRALRRGSSRRSLGVALGLAGTLVVSLGLGVVPAAHADSLLLPVQAASESPLAQTAAPVTQSGITVTGDGVVSARPDVVILRMSVTTSGASPSAAVREAQQVSDRVVQRLRELGVAEADIQVNDLDVTAEQELSDPDDCRLCTGPAMSSRGTPRQLTMLADAHAEITARLNGAPDSARIQQVLDAVVQAGVTSVAGLTFDVRDTSALHRQALAAAIQDARAKAEAIAAAAGLKLGSVRAVTEQAFASSFQKSDLSSSSGDTLVVRSGEIVVRVEVSFNLG